MSALPITVSTAGYAALVNAENTGTNPVLISQIGITDVSFAPSSGLSSLPGEIKRLTTFAGAVVAPDTVHVTIRDDSEEVYSLRGFALYLEDGTLFASYGQASVILEKSSLAMLLLAADVRFTNIDAALLEFGDTNWINPPATTEVKGVVELATPEETADGIDPGRAVTPAGMKVALDGRFGAGAPSAFFKGLMTAATAAILRATLGLGNAAVRNEGAGGGLDADLLDGQHGVYYLAWANLSGKPATFAPSAHGHVWADVTGAPATATRWPSWLEVTDKPSTFTPSSHTHAAADITAGTFVDARIPALAISKTTGLQAALDGKALANLSNANGIIPDVCLPLRLREYAQLISDWNSALGNGWYMSPDAVNAPGAGWVIGQVESHNADWVTQTVRQFTTDSGADSAMYRRDRNGGGWSAWVRVRISEGELDARYAQVGHTHAIPNIAGLQAALDARAALSTNVVFRDVTASRGDGTGVIFLNNTQDRYLYWDGTKYILNVGGLAVGGAVSAPKFSRSSSRRYKESIETMSPEKAASLLSMFRWVEYRLKSDGSFSVGAIAEELADGPLDFVVERNAQGEPESVNYDPLFALACAALNGILGRVAALEARAV